MTLTFCERLPRAAHNDVEFIAIIQRTGPGAEARSTER